MSALGAVDEGWAEPGAGAAAGASATTACASAAGLAAPAEADHTVVDAVHRQLLGSAPALVESPSAAAVESLVRAEAPLLAVPAVAAVVEAVLARVRGLGPLDPLLALPDVSEVMVNGDGRVWIERSGRCEPTPLWLEPDAVLHLIERILAPLGRRVDRVSPLVDARLPDGSRVHAAVAPVAVDGPCLTIRRFRVRQVGLHELCSPEVASLLRAAVADRRNLLVCGGTGGGKTTLLNALAAEIPPATRLVTVEDAAELRLPGEHVVRLEARPPGAEGAGAVSIRDLVRNALRMRPDRIVVGEVRGPEALDMLWAMNTGHEGSASTCHANGPADALRRLEAMCLLGQAGLPLAVVRDQVGAALDLVVEVARRADGSRRVVEVAEVVEPRGPSERPGLRALADGDRVVATPARPARGDATAPPPRSAPPRSGSAVDLPSSSGSSDRTTAGSGADRWVQS